MPTRATSGEGCESWNASSDSDPPGVAMRARESYRAFSR